MRWRFTLVSSRFHATQKISQTQKDKQAEAAIFSLWNIKGIWDKRRIFCLLFTICNTSVHLKTPTGDMLLIFECPSFLSEVDHVIMAAIRIIFILNSSLFFIFYMGKDPAHCSCSALQFIGYTNILALLGLYQEYLETRNKWYFTTHLHLR